MSTGWVPCVRAIYGAMTGLHPESTGIVRATGARPMSVRCKATIALKLDDAEEVQRRVRQKSLSLRDSSDMDHTPDQARHWRPRPQ
jgi:hypothetical protein